MAYSRDLSRHHIVTLDTKNVKVLSQPRPDDELPSGVFGPFNLVTYLFVPRVGDHGMVHPGRNFIKFYLGEVWPIRTPWTITAAVTEIQLPETPWQGEARFDTLGVNLMQEDSEIGPWAHVWLNLEWHSPLPVGVMATIGFT